MTKSKANSVATIRADLAASGGAGLVGYKSPRTGSSATTVEAVLNETIRVTEFIGASDTINMQNGINALAAAGAGILKFPPGRAYTLSSSLDFSVLPYGHNQKIIDFNGATITWTGDITVAHNMFNLFNNQQVTIKNFNLVGNIAHIVGINADSLQPLGSDGLCFDNFTISACDIGVKLGSTTGGGQNRVSDSRMEKYVINGCTVGVYTGSTNVDSWVFGTGITSGCDAHFWFNRAGFIKIDSATGYGFNGAKSSFIYVDGPVGILTVIASQSERVGGTAYFYRRTDYTLSQHGPATFIGCTMDDSVLCEVGAGSAPFNIIVIGGRITDFTTLGADTRVSLIGVTQPVATDTLTVTGVGSRLYTQGCYLLGTRVYTEPSASENGALTTQTSGAVQVTLCYSIPGVAPATFTPATHNCYWIKIGSLVTFNIAINLTAFTKNLSTGLLQITGLPYTATHHSVGQLMLNNAPFTGAATAFVPAATSNIILYKQTTGAALSSLDDPTATSEYYVAGSYLTT